MPSIFSRIISGELPASVVYRDAHCVAFMDIHPISPGHALVVPRREVLTLAELDKDIYGHLWEVARRVGQAQQQALKSQAQHFLVNDGPGANQTVSHVHLHVIPRYRGDGLRSVWRMISHVGIVALSPPINQRKRQQLDQQAARIADALSAAATQATRSAGS